MAEFDPDKFLAEDNIAESKSFDPDEFLSETTPDVKKKEQTEPTQAAPLPGLGGVSEEPTPSPSVGQKPVEKTISGIGLDLSKITPQLIDLEEDEAISILKKNYSSLGFEFEKTGVGDAVIVRKNGNEEVFDLDPWTSSTEVSEAERMKKWMTDNSTQEDVRKQLRSRHSVSKQYADPQELEVNVTDAVPAEEKEIDSFDREFEQFAGPSQKLMVSGVDTDAINELNRQKEEEAKKKEAMRMAVGKADGSVVQEVSGFEEGISPGQDIIISNKIEAKKAKSSESHWEGGDNYYANVYLNYLDETSPNQANDLRSRIENDKDFFNKEKSNLKSPSAEVVKGGLDIILGVTQDNYVSASEKASGIVDQITELEPQLEKHLDRIDGKSYNGNPEQFQEYSDLISQINQLSESQEMRELRRSIDALDSTYRDYETNPDVNILDAYETIKGNYQRQVDAAYFKNSFVSDLLTPITDGVMRSGLGLVSNVASFVNNINADNEWGTTDDIAAWAKGAADTYDLRNPAPSKFSRDFYEEVAVVGDYEVELKGGKPTGRVFGSNGYLAQTDITENILKQYNDDPDLYDKETNWNVRSGLYSSTEVGIDMVMGLIPVAGVAGKGFKAIGFSETLSATLGMSTAIVVQSQDEFVQMAKDAGANDQEALAFGMAQSAAIAAIAAINPVEAKALMRMTGSAQKSLAKKYVQNIVGGMSRKDAAAEVTKSLFSRTVSTIGTGGKAVLKEAGKEGLEETLEIPAGDIISSGWNIVGGVNTYTEKDIAEYINTFFLAGAGSLPFAFLGLSGDVKTNSKKELTYSATQKIDTVRKLFEENLGKKIKDASGKEVELTQEYIDEHIGQLEELSKMSEVYFSNKSLTEADKIAITDLLSRKRSFDSKTTDDVSKNTFKPIIDDINSSLNEYLNKGSKTPFYVINGVAMNKQQVEERLSDEDFVAGLRNGRIDVRIKNDKEMQSRFNDVVKVEKYTVPAKQKGRLTKFSTPKDGIVGEVTYEDGTKKELTQEEYDALEKQEGLFDVPSEDTQEQKRKKAIDRNERIEKALAILEPIASAREELTVEQLAEVSEVLGEDLAGELISDQISKAPDAVDLYNLLDDNKVKIDDTQVTEQERLDTEEQRREEDAGQVQEPGVSQEEGAADTVLQEEEELVSTTEEELDAIDKELSDQGVVEGALTGRSRKRKVVKAVRNGIKAISKALPNVKIKLYETQDEYEQATGRKGRGFYNFKEKSISINLESANARTVAHEIFHAFLFDKISTNEEAANISAKLFLELEKVEGKDSKILKELEEFASLYREDGIGVMTEEKLAEYLGKVAENYDSLSARGKRAVREFVNSMLELIGKANPETKEFLPSRVSGNEVVDMLVGIGERVSAGEVIETEQIEGLFTPEITVEVSEATKATDREQLNPEEVKSKNVKGKKVGKGLSVKQVKGEKVKEGIDNISVKKAREASPNLYIKNANILKDYDVVKGVKKFREIKSLKQADEVYDIFVNEVSENLIYLHDKFNQDLLDYATLWYDGANQIAQEFASKFDISLEQAAGIIAAQSPQKDWYQNVRLAEMVLEQFKANPVFTQEALDFQKEINERGYEDKSGDKLRKARERGDKLIAALESFVGQNLNDIPDAFKPYVVRTTQEISGSKDYDVISPDGRRVGLAKKNDGSNAKVAWGSYTEIGKSVAIYLNGSEKNISDQLGVMHKIRNFFNNIADPMSEDNDVTMDTHAVAAALLKPLSGKSEQVKQNFGTGTSNSGPLGLKGVYYAFADAYVKAAKEKGILPREMQSITWEAARGLFTDSYKNNKDNVKEVNDIFKDYTNGKITKDEAREKVLEAAGGVNDPTWAGPILSELGKDSKKKADTGRLPGDERGVKRTEAKPRDRRRDTGDVSGVTGRDQKIKATIDFKNRYGKYFSISKIFSNEKHLDNYISFMERKGNKEIGVEIGVDVPDVSPTQPFAGREQKNAPLFSGKNKNIIDLANKYIAKKGLAAPEDTEIRRLNTEYSKAMADVYESAKHTPLDEDVQKAYKALAKESKEQFEVLKKGGYIVELWDGANEPYKNSTEMVEDLKDNKHLYVFSTEEGFGETGITPQDRRENPMLADSGYKDANGKKLLLNDLFRFVHDAFGHGKLGNSFGPVGEENAWYVHSQMFSPDARRAMTSETRGQNSWVNFGPQLRNKDGSLPKKGDKNYVPLSQRDFAPQKNFLFPDEYVFDRPNTQGRFEGRDQKVKVDKSTIKKNVVAAVDFIKKAALKIEDGVTLNIDGTRYDGGGLVVPISSMNVEQGTLKPSTVADFVEMNKGKLSNDTFKLGLYKFPKESTVSIDLSVIVPNENRKLALSVGKKLNQESLFDLDTGENIKTGGTGQNTVELTDEQAAELATSLSENKEPEFLGREQKTKEKKRGFLDRNIEKLKFASSLSESVFENPEAFYEPQVLAEIKEKAKYMSDSELIEAMSLDGLNSIMNISGSTNTNMAVIAAAELINRKLAAGQDVESVVLQLNKMGTAVGQLMRQFGELKKSTPAGYMLTVERLAEKNNIKLKESDRSKISRLVQTKTDLINDLNEATEKRIDPNLTLDEQKKLDKEIKKISNELYKVDSELNRFVQTKIPLKLTDALIQIMQGNLLTLGSLVVNILGNTTQLGLSVPIKFTASVFDSLRRFIIGGERTTSFSIPAYLYGAKSFAKSLPDAARILFWKGPRDDYNEMLKGEINNGLLGIRAWMALMSKGGIPEPSNMSKFDKLLSKINKDLGEKKYFAKADIFLSILSQGTFGVPADWMFRALQTGDVVFKRPYRDMSLYEIGKRKGLSGDKLDSLLKYPSKKDLQVAEEIAKEGTFQEDSTISMISKEGVDFLSKWSSKFPFFGNILKLLVRSKFPYVKTPANIASFTFKMCVPEVALAASAVYLSKGDNRKAALNFGIGVTGSMMSMVATGLVANGLAQSMGDDDEPEVRGMKFAEFPPGTMNKSGLKRVIDYIKEGYDKGGASEMGDRFNQFLTGDIPKNITDIRDGEDEFISYLKLGMPGFVLGVYAMEERDTVKDRAINAKKDDITKIFFTEAIRLPQSIRFVTQQSFLQGTADLMNLMTLKEDAVRDWLVNTVKTVSSIALPNQLASFARTQRDYLPDYRSDDAWTQIKNVLDDKIFFLRKETPMNQIRVDIWGRSIDQTPEGANRYMYHLGLDPLRKTKPSEDLVNSEILDLAVRTKSSIAYPEFINDVIKSYYRPTGKKEPFVLSQDQVNRLQRIYGQKNYEKVRKLILDGNDNVKLEWEFMDDETKLNKLSKIYSETKKDKEFENEKKRILTDILLELGR